MLHYRNPQLYKAGIGNYEGIKSNENEITTKINKVVKPK